LRRAVHFNAVVQKQTLAHHAITEVKAGEKKRPKLTARRQNARQFHDLKAINKLWKNVENFEHICSIVTNRNCLHEEPPKIHKICTTCQSETQQFIYIQQRQYIVRATCFDP
jgi:hypothetical protein